MYFLGALEFAMLHVNSGQVCIYSIACLAEGKAKVVCLEPMQSRKRTFQSLDLANHNSAYNAYNLGQRGMRQTLQGSLSAVSKRNFATKYAFDSIFQVLQDVHTFAPLQTQQFRKNRY